MQVLIPPPVEFGTYVAVVSPSGVVREVDIARGLQALDDWKLDVRVAEHVFERHGYLAGSDAQRAASLQAALDDDRCSAIVFSRGGYGAMRILDLVDFGVLRRRPKWLVGFSDITALHLRVAGIERVATLHGPVLKSFGLHEAWLDSLRAVLTRGQSTVTLQGVPVRGGAHRGRLLGGNLSLVVAMLDGRHMPDLDGAILLIEDVGEQDYRIDRLLAAVRQSRRAAALGGIVVGDFTECAGAYVSEDGIQAFVQGLAGELGDAIDCPVVADFPAGHGPRNIACVMGLDATIDGTSGTIEFPSGQP